MTADHMPREPWKIASETILMPFLDTLEHQLAAQAMHRDSIYLMRAYKGAENIGPPLPAGSLCDCAGHYRTIIQFYAEISCLQGETRKIFVEFLERSCTAEFSGFLLYKELGRRLKKTNPVGISLLKALLIPATAVPLSRARRPATEGHKT